MTPSALVDTSAFLALANPRDQHHDQAVRAAKRFSDEGGRFVSTVLVLGEFYSHMLYLAGPAHARRVVGDLLDDPIYSWADVGVDLLTASMSAWLERFTNQRFSLIDAVSFEVMRREGVRTAFAFDRHFRIAAFELLQ